MMSMRLVNGNKGIEFDGMAYVYNTSAEAQKVLEDIKAVSKFHKVDVHKVLFDTCVEITDVVVSAR